MAKLTIPRERRDPAHHGERAAFLRAVRPVVEKVSRQLRTRRSV